MRSGSVPMSVIRAIGRIDAEHALDVMQEAKNRGVSLDELDAITQISRDLEFAKKAARQPK